MTHAILCPGCQHRVGVPENMVGRRVRCPKCREIFEASIPPTSQSVESIRATPPPLPVADMSHESDRSEPQYEVRPKRRRRRFDDYDYDDFDTPHPRFRQGTGLSGRALGTVIGLVLCILAYIGCILADLNLANFLSRLPRGGVGVFAMMDEANRVDAIRLTAAMGRFACIIFTAVFFSFWVYRAHDNMYLFRVRGMKSTPGSAVGSFFIPVLNLFQPIQVMQNLWKASDPRSSPESWRRGPISALIPIWWIVTLIGSGTIFVSIQMIMNAQQSGDPGTIIDMSRSAAFLSALGGAISIVGAVLAILVVRFVTKRQEEKYRRLQTVDEFAEEDDFS